MADDKPLSGKIALVTGASRGIGAAVAKSLAAKGAHVIALARTTGGLEELDDEISKLGGTATLVPADLRKYDDLDRMGAALFERFKKLDILVGNAGQLGVLSPIPHVDMKAWDEVIAVNVTANYRLIRSLDMLLRASDAARAVFISSGAANKATAYWGPYAVSKTAMDMLVRTYASEVSTTPMKVNLFNPGPIRTRMRAKAMPGEDPMTLTPPETVAEAIVELCLPSVTQNGQLYDYPQKKWLSYRGPA
ncbi:MAG: SDR family NAD(P)-dependent oxidoreductase [Xanthobacteraceae bacterium]|nr:SDR family NAD(P)-dependent oxidoreductase [Xanthobacteraceae bacterium]QYK45976.1 MAG: SDR family NAD(P)-dependent oxidoreductase [Xanthobacteraceae bacterium]